MPDQLLDADAIERHLREVADELGTEPQRTIILVGGALLAGRGLREATRDVDSAESLDSQLRDAVARVAARYDMAPGWFEEYDEHLIAHVRALI